MDPQPAPLPTQIGRCLVRRRLGGGGFGEVYLAHDAVMDRDVAVKVPSRRLLESQQARDAFLHEARRAARLQHEGIVRVYDFGQEPNGVCYLVYEYIEGITRRDVLCRQGRPRMDQLHGGR